MLKNVVLVGAAGLLCAVLQCGRTLATEVEEEEEQIVGKRKAYEPPPQHFQSQTIDQLIVEAYGGTDVVNNLPSKITEGGLVTAELDMNLTPKQLEEIYKKEFDRPRGKRKASPDVRTRWPNSVIPYEINNRDFSRKEIKEIKEALADWAKMTCIRFRPATAADKNKVKYQNGPGCNSALGMIGGPQIINLQRPGCRFKGLYLHETGHAIGLVHEHQLPQRDSYISIQYGNVAPTLRQWFNKYNRHAVDTMGVEYDYASVMHYGKTAFSYNGQAQTIYAHDRSKENLIGKVAQKGLSFSDVKTVNLMYNCSAQCPAQPSCRSPCFVNKECKCFCKDDMPKVPCENKESNAKCADWASRNECSKNKGYMESHCKKTCGLCPGDSGKPSVPTTATPESCINKLGDQRCEQYAVNGECERTHREWLAKNCQKSCKKCPSDGSNTTPRPTTGPQCTNSYGHKQCKDWSTRGECDRNPRFMHHHCRKACGRCGDAGGGGGSIGNITVDANCKDTHSLCSSWKTFCKSNDYVIKHCPLTCGSCKQPGPSKPNGSKPSKGKGRKNKGKGKGRKGKGKKNKKKKKKKKNKGKGKKKGKANKNKAKKGKGKTGKGKAGKDRKDKAKTDKSRKDKTKNRGRISKNDKTKKPTRARG